MVWLTTFEHRPHYLYNFCDMCVSQYRSYNQVTFRNRNKPIARVKSITAREMWEQHEPFLAEYLWGGGFWEESYYVGTAGDVSTDTIEQYIERAEHV